MASASSASWRVACHVGEVGANEVTSDLVCGLLPNITDVVDDDSRAGFGIALGDLPSDAAPSTGYERHPSGDGVYRVGHVLLFSLEKIPGPET